MFDEHVDRGLAPPEPHLAVALDERCGRRRDHATPSGSAASSSGGARAVDEHVDVDVDGAPRPLRAPRERERAAERVRDVGVVERGVDGDDLVDQRRHVSRSVRSGTSAACREGDRASARGAPGTARRARAPRPARDRVPARSAPPDRGRELDPELVARGADDAVEGLDRGHLPAGLVGDEGGVRGVGPPRQGSQAEARPLSRTRRSVAAASMTTMVSDRIPGRQAGAASRLTTPGRRPPSGPARRRSDDPRTAPR